jgi:hypothetical protein
MNFSLADARIFVDNEKNRLVVIQLAKCDNISLVWVIDCLSTHGGIKTYEGGKVRNVIPAFLEPLTDDDYKKLNG